MSKEQSPVIYTIGWLWFIVGLIMILTVAGDLTRAGTGPLHWSQDPASLAAIIIIDQTGGLVLAFVFHVLKGAVAILTSIAYFLLHGLSLSLIATGFDAGLLIPPLASALAGGTILYLFIGRGGPPVSYLSKLALIWLTLTGLAALFFLTGEQLSDWLPFMASFILFYVAEIYFAAPILDNIAASRKEDNRIIAGVEAGFVLFTLLGNVLYAGYIYLLKVRGIHEADSRRWFGW